MGQPRFEVPTGIINGVNLVFTVSLGYLPGSTAVWLNGVLLEPSGPDGWIESDPPSGEITMKEAPLSSGPCPDVLQVFFKDSLPDPADTIVEGIVGIVEEEVEVSGVLVDCPLVGSVAVEDVLSAQIVCDDIPIVGLIEVEVELTGTVVGVDC